MRIRQQLVASTTRVYGNKNRRRKVTIHNTGNTNRGANAAMHAKLQSGGNVRNASWHWQVDDKEAVQSFVHTKQCWHAGDGRGPGNLDSIAIEMCMNPDSHWPTTVENTATLVRKILADEGLTVSDVVQHHHWSGKNCPQWLRTAHGGISWDDFLGLLRAPLVLGCRTLKVRSYGEDVSELQDRLNALPTVLPLLDVDGDYYTKTAERVAELQTQAGQPGTGIFDQDTYADLLNAESPPVVPEPEPAPVPEPEPLPETEPEAPPSGIFGVIVSVLLAIGRIIRNLLHRGDTKGNDMKNIIARIVRAWDALYPVDRRDIADKLALKTFGQALVASPIGIAFGAWASGAVEHQEIGTRSILVMVATSLSIAVMAAMKSWLRNAKVPDVLDPGGPV